MIILRIHVSKTHLFEHVCVCAVCEEFVFCWRSFHGTQGQYQTARPNFHYKCRQGMLLHSYAILRLRREGSIHPPFQTYLDQLPGQLIDLIAEPVDACIPLEQLVFYPYVKQAP